MAAPWWTSRGARAPALRQISEPNELDQGECGERRPGRGRWSGLQVRLERGLSDERSGVPVAEGRLLGTPRSTAAVASMATKVCAVGRLHAWLTVSLEPSPDAPLYYEQEARMAWPPGTPWRGAGAAAEDRQRPEAARTTHRGSAPGLPSWHCAGTPVVALRRRSHGSCHSWQNSATFHAAISGRPGTISYSNNQSRDLACGQGGP